jgi:hypothetical protein
MKSQPILRLDKTPSTQRPPAADCVDLIYDAESGALKAIDSTGDVPFAGGGGSVTAESINAALDGEALVVDSLAPSDSSGVALPDGEVAWNETLGGWVRHDGTTIGGVLLVPQDPWYSKGGKAILGASQTVNLHTELASFPITSAQAVVGSRFRLSGSYSVVFTGTRPSAAYVGIIPDLTATDDITIIYGADHSGSTLKVVNSSFVWEFELQDAGSGKFFLATYTHGASETRLTGTTSSVALIGTGDVYAMGAEEGTAGAAQDLIFQLKTEAQASAGLIVANWDIRLQQLA